MGGHVVLTRRAVECIAEARARYDDAMAAAFGKGPAGHYVMLDGRGQVEAVAKAVGAEPKADAGSLFVDAFGAQFFASVGEEGL